MHQLQFFTSRARIWVLANVIGVTLYLYSTSSLWPTPGDENNPGGPGDAFYWVFIVLPVLLLFIAVNLAALIHLARTRIRSLTPRILIWLLVAGFWLCAVAYDRHMSRNVIF